MMIAFGNKNNKFDTFINNHQYLKVLTNERLNNIRSNAGMSV